MVAKYAAKLAWAPEWGCTLANFAPNRFLRALAGEILDDVDLLAAAVIALAWIAFRVFIGKHAAHGLP